MRVRDAMTEEVTFAGPDDTIVEVAQMMAEVDVGALPIGDADTLRGIITDRDILIRVVAQGRELARTRAADVMSSDVFTCSGEDRAEAVLTQMEERQVRRMPVTDDSGRIIGIVTRSNLVDSLRVHGQGSETDREAAESDALASPNQPAS